MGHCCYKLGKAPKQKAETKQNPSSVGTNSMVEETIFVTIPSYRDNGTFVFVMFTIRVSAHTTRFV